jgi:uncharacterized protein (TIGR02147 family)
MESHTPKDTRPLLPGQVLATEPVVDIYGYKDFKSFLKDYYRERRAKDRKFSIRFFARRAGLKSQNYLKVVMDGRRSLTPRNLPKFIKGLGLVGLQAEYFEALVNLNQARDQVEQRAFLDRIEHLERKKTTHTLSGEQLELYSCWYHLAIFEMACQEGFVADPKAISVRLKDKITVEQAQESLDLMFHTGLLKRDLSGKIVPVASKIASSDLIPQHYKKKLHDSFLKLAADALSSGEVPEMRSLTIGLTPEQVPAFKAKLQEFQREMNTLFSSGKGTDIFQMNLQFFKLTKNN